jgi:hypothetical protein
VKFMPDVTTGSGPRFVQPARGRTEFAADSLLEGDGFEPPVPREEKSRYPIGAQLSLSMAPVTLGRCRGSGFTLQQQKFTLDAQHLGI